MKCKVKDEGWLYKQMNECGIDCATWPKWMQRPGWDERLTVEQKKEAARRLRARADELDPPEQLASTNVM